MRFSFLLASTLTFGYGKPPFPHAPSPCPHPPSAATASLLPRAGTLEQCESACSSLSSALSSILSGGNTTATAALCSNSTLQGLKSCFQCAHQFAPESFPLQQAQDALNQFVAECNKAGFSVQSVTLNGSGKGAAPSTYQASVKVAGAVGVVAAAGLLAL